MKGERGIWLCLLEVKGHLLKEAANGTEVPGSLGAQMKLHVNFTEVLCPCVLFPMFKACMVIAACHC